MERRKEIVEDANRQMASGGCCVPVLMMAMAITIAIAMSSCCACKQVPAVEVLTDTVYQSKLQRDSIHVHDSIYIHDYTKGDTVYRDRHHWHTEYIERERTDTVFECKTDSIPYPVEVPRKRSKLEWTEVIGFWVLLGLGAVIGVMRVRKLKLRVHKA